MACKGFFARSHTADVFCIEVHKGREKVRGIQREYIDEKEYNVAAMKVNCVYV